MKTKFIGDLNNSQEGFEITNRVLTRNDPTIIHDNSTILNYLSNFSSSLNKRKALEFLSEIRRSQRVRKEKNLADHFISSQPIVS